MVHLWSIILEIAQPRNGDRMRITLGTKADRRRQTEPTANVLILFEKGTAASGNGGRSVRQAVGLCQCLDAGVDVGEAGGRYSLVDASIVVQATRRDVVHGRGNLKTIDRRYS
jgi:hypothetical protein